MRSDAAFLSLEHQLHLADVLGKHAWQVDIAAPSFTFTGDHPLTCNAVHFLGTAAAVLLAEAAQPLRQARPSSRAQRTLYEMFLPQDGMRLSGIGTPTLGRRAEHGSPARVLQTSIFSAISIASSISMPRYRTVLSIFVCPSKSWTARRLPVRR
jgi:hypothetical protein